MIPPVVVEYELPSIGKNPLGFGDRSVEDEFGQASVNDGSGLANDDVVLRRNPDVPSSALGGGLSHRHNVHPLYVQNKEVRRRQFARQPGSSA